MTPNLPHLRRFWFPVPGHLGIGVTAYTRQEAEAQARDAADRLAWELDRSEVVVDVDIRDLDQNHVVPNMTAAVWRGVWFPKGL